MNTLITKIKNVLLSFTSKGKVNINGNTYKFDKSVKIVAIIDDQYQIYLNDRGQSNHIHIYDTDLSMYSDNLRSTNIDVNIDKVYGKVTNMSGDINITSIEAGDHNISTMSGNIKIMNSSGCNFITKTKSGNIDIKESK